jgi:glycine dehydrogenase subunit 2
MLSEICGLAEFSLNPYAGAHGELTGLMIIRDYHHHRNDRKRTKILVPTSAHGTNPASAAVCGLEVVEIESNPDGTVNLDSLKANLNDEVAGIMMTNPNTLGMYEKDILEIADAVHQAGGLLYYDGANLNALLGYARPGDMGFDVIHLNLHKTFSTPHGGGGPGSGPVGVNERLRAFLPSPRVVKKDSVYQVEYKEDVVQISSFYGNMTVIIRAYIYLKTLGKDNLKNVARLAVLNANYIKHQLQDVYDLPIKKHCKHEVVFNGLKDKSSGVTTLDVAKRLLDLGYHSPTIYFPLLIEQALMVEPTEVESLQTLDEFIQVMKQIAQEAKSDPEALHHAPYHTPVRRLDEALAARKPIIKFQDMHRYE